MQREFTTHFEEISPQDQIELNKCVQKFYLSARESDGRGRSFITRQNCKRWQQQMSQKSFYLRSIISLF